MDSAINEAARVANNRLRALKDNPTMLATGADLSVVSVASSAGYHSGGTPSDIDQPAFVAYERFRICSQALDECLATLAITLTVALQNRAAEPPPRFAKLRRMVHARWDLNTPTASASGEPLRALLQDFNNIGSGAA
jgi:hypothetical protein